MVHAGKDAFDIDERMSVIGTEGIIHIQDTFPNLAIVDNSKLHSPDTAYWPMFNGVRGGALRDEFNYFASCALEGKPEWSEARRWECRSSAADMPTRMSLRPARSSSNSGLGPIPIAFAPSERCSHLARLAS